jgi:hypothetical protein
MTKTTPEEISEGIQDALRKRDSDYVVGVGSALIVIQVILGIMCFIVGWGSSAPLGFSLLALTVLGTWVGVKMGRR